MNPGQPRGTATAHVRAGWMAGGSEGTCMLIATDRPSGSREVWDRFWSGQRPIGEIYSTGDRIVEALAGVLDPQGKWVLEVGAGSGRDSLRLAEMGARVVALDYSPAAVRTVRELAKQQGVAVFVVLGDALQMPFRPGAFDLVFHQGLLEHFRDPLPLLRANMAVLRPGGYVLVDVPQKYHPYTAIKHLLMWIGRWFAGWETEYTIGGLESLVRSVGLTPVKCYGDWMRPSLFYRSLRLALLRVGVRLPMHPKGIPILRDIRAAVRRRLRRKRWAYYTFLDVGVVACLPAAADLERA